MICYIAVMKLPHKKPVSFDGRVCEDGKSVQIAAPAKINLFLRVMGKRPDGYHDIFSWFQALDLVDQLEIEVAGHSNIEIISDHPDVPTGPDNLITMAAQALREAIGMRMGFRVRLTKAIPVGAGLGGGSSDAAAFIKGVNRLLNLALTRQQMVQIGLRVGSDVPFFFGCGQAEVTGRGEIVKDIELPTDYEVVLVTPRFQIRAAEAYRKVNLDLTDTVQVITLPERLQVDALIGVISKMANDLERGLLMSYPILDRVKRVLVRSGADIVRLSGSGPTVFALYRDKGQSMERLAQTTEGGKWDWAKAHPVVLPA